jgi:hypothetical protein
MGARAQMRAPRLRQLLLPLSVNWLRAAPLQEAGGDDGQRGKQALALPEHAGPIKQGMVHGPTAGKVVARGHPWAL